MKSSTGSTGPVPKLTWNAVFPSRYESAWSIFGKVAVYNNLSMQQISKLIAKSGHKKTRCEVSWHQSNWIDFPKFALLLSVEEWRIREGFLDQLGFVPPTENIAGIKHCPLCAEANYHCVFFDLDVFVQCPVHHIDLAKPCKYCAKSTTFALRENFGGISQRRCNACGSSLPYFEELIAIKRPSFFESNGMTQACSIVEHWWGAVRNDVPSASLTLGRISRVGGAGSSYVEDFWTRCQLGRAIQLKENLSELWKLAYSPIPSLSVCWLSLGSPLTDKQEFETLINDDLGRCYKSLRRHIQSRFLRGHERCCSVLMSLNEHEVHHLDGEIICPVALAFVAWRIAVEGYMRVKGLRKVRAADHPLRFPPTLNGLGDIDSMLRLLTYEFFSIWFMIKDNHLKQNIRIYRSPGFSGNCSVVYHKPSKSEVDTGGAATFSATYPICASPPLREKLPSCRIRNKSQLHSHTRIFAMSKYASNETMRSLLFETHAPRHIRARFIYIGV